MLPFVQEDPEQAAEILSSYLNTYIKEEIREEGLVRRVPPFVRFLCLAGQFNGQMVNLQNITLKEAGVSQGMVDTDPSILMDTLLGHFLPAWRPGLKVREAAHPKFDWFDPGVARAAAGWLRDPVHRLWRGAALESLVYHELRVQNEVSRKLRPVFFYRTPAGVEVTLLSKPPDGSGNSLHVVAVEVKRTERWEREPGKNTCGA